MAANDSGVQVSTLRSLALAWVLTLPRAIALSALLWFAMVRASRLLGCVFQHKTGRWLEIRRVRFQAHRLRFVRREEEQDEAETDGYLGNVGSLS
jgi:hypothetical protein